MSGYIIPLNLMIVASIFTLAGSIVTLLKHRGESFNKAVGTWFLIVGFFLQLIDSLCSNQSVKEAVLSVVLSIISIFICLSITYILLLSIHKHLFPNHPSQNS